MPVLYNNNSVIPSPLVTITKSPVTDESLSKSFDQYSISLQGAIIATDNPAIADTPAGMDTILAGQANLRSIFSEDGKLLQIQTPPSGNSIEFYVKIDNLTFEPGIWYNICKYRVDLTANVLVGEDDTVEALLGKNESWSFTENPNGSVQISHFVQAKGLTWYDDSGTKHDGLDEARAWCDARKISIDDNGILSLGSLSTNFNSVANGSGLINDIPTGTSNYWNLGVAETLGDDDNTWEINESILYVVPSGSLKSREEFTIQVGIDEGIVPESRTIDVQGTIFGLAGNDNDGSVKFTNALNDFNNTIETLLQSRASTYSPAGFTFNPSPISSVRTLDEIFGTVQYNYSFRASKSPLVSGVIQEELSIDDSGPTDVVVEIPVVGRLNGPVIQYLNTKTSVQRRVSYSCVMSSGAVSDIIGVASILNAYNAKPNVDFIFNALEPTGADSYYVTEHSESWNPHRLSFQKSLAWTIDKGTGSYDGLLDPDNFNQPGSGIP